MGSPPKIMVCPLKILSPPKPGEIKFSPPSEIGSKIAKSPQHDGGGRKP